ncbi:glycoside hydrolase family 31 protein [Atopobacter sp. AH10]|uniref:glycoside hydrolase family 31 protein n=1 Tax=Atopobacter sp. AH10 TaxID=2315861 RepID=UPI000EF1CC44|nr:TIM-barrel domain-containing protein [Atopobacter sp. AH10]RLK62841.1 glycoside hydrolase family 31 protein [Atopobacter sp. AH10]
MIDIMDRSFSKAFNDELLLVQAWGDNAIRIRSFVDMKYVDRFNALLDEPISSEKVVINKNMDGIELINGKIKVVLDHRNRLTFYNNNDQVLLKEYIRLRAVKHDDGSEDVGTVDITKDFNSTLKLKSREYRSNLCGNFQVITRFESEPKEKIFGMGQYQQQFLDLKNTILELAQRNSQASIPFYISSMGYGFLWNNPGIGEVSFAKNITRWKMYSSDYIDYVVISGDEPKEILRNYANMTGKVPQMPDKLLGLWQSKLRYRTAKEVVDVVNEYKRRGIQLSTIAIDYFHWPKQGEYRFDEEYWPNPQTLISRLKNNYCVEPLISIWPTVQTDAKNYEDYFENGYLVKVNRGVPVTMQIQGNTMFIDMTNSEARNYVWSLIKKNYVDIGARYLWLDVAEPGYSVYDFDNYRYKKGSDLYCGNLYPIGYLTMVYEGLKDHQSVVTLVRGSWAGAQRYGALLWSGDIDSSFEAFRNQINTGLNVGLAGLPWWTTDIGGFHGGNPKDPEFRELLIRWFQYATFSPILRMHGDRLPHSKPLSNHGGGSMVTGAPNEIWSYGEKVEELLVKYVKIREVLKPYISKLMNEAHQFGDPVMRTLFYEYSNDPDAWDIEDTYLLGDALLIAPIEYYQETSRPVYLPKGDKWIDVWREKEYEGGEKIIIQANINQIPVFIKASQKEEFADLFAVIKEEF